MDVNRPADLSLLTSNSKKTTMKLKVRVSLKRYSMFNVNYLMIELA